MWTRSARVWGRDTPETVIQDGRFAPALGLIGSTMRGVSRMDHKGLASMTAAAKLRSTWRRALLLALGLPILLSSAPIFAQAPAAPSPERQVPHWYKKLTIDDQVKSFARNLDLNEAQQSAVKRILEQRQQETLRIQRATTPIDRIDAFRALQIRTAAQIRAVLNDEQKTKYNPLVQRPPQTSPQRSVEDWMKATTSH